MAQTCPGWSCHVKWSQTEFEPNQTNTNGFNQFRFRFQKFWLKPNSSVSGLRKNGLNQTKPNFPNTSSIRWPQDDEQQCDGDNGRQHAMARYTVVSCHFTFIFFSL